MKRSFLGILFFVVLATLSACNAPQNVDPNQIPATSSGNIEVLSPASLPTLIQNAVNQDFTGQTVTEALKETGSEGSVMYTVTMSSKANASYNAMGQKCTILTLTSLPQAITDYVAKNHASTNIARAVQMPEASGSNLTMVRLADQKVLTFDASNNFLTSNSTNGNGEKEEEDCVEDAIAVSSLLQSIRDYIAANYAGQTIKEAYKKTCKNNLVQYEVELSDGTEVYFDANGQFIKEEKDDDDHKSSGSNATIIAVTALPQTAQTYLNTQYAGKTVVKASKETLTNGTVQYEVELSDGTEVYFDATGQFIKEEKEGTETMIAVTALPQMTHDYITANYAGKTIIKAYKVTYSDGTIQYEVELNDDTELYFDVNGQFIRVEKDK